MIAVKKSRHSERRGDETGKWIALDRERRVSRLIVWNVDNGLFCVRCEEAVNAFIGLRLRRQKALRTIKRCCGELGPWRWIDRYANIACMEIPSGEGIKRLFGQLTAELARVAYEPFTPKLLLQALPITNKERLRWMKDNRLPRYGSIIVRRGQAIAVPTYAVELVEHLTSNPKIVETWRNEDRQEELAG